MTATRHPPRKRFGQNFLVDRHYIDRIIAAVDPAPDDNVVEIGPGLGALTRPLLERVKRLAVIEIDRDLVARLGAEFSPDRLRMHNVDALTFDFATLGRELRVIGNLPYNISSPMLFHLAQYETNLRDVTVMLQREVVQRMAAAPATPDYGRLSVMLQTRFRIERLFIVPPGAMPSRSSSSSVASNLSAFFSVLRRCPKAAATTRAKSASSSILGRARSSGVRRAIAESTRGIGRNAPGGTINNRSMRKRVCSITESLP